MYGASIKVEWFLLPKVRCILVAPERQHSQTHTACRSGINGFVLALFVGDGDDSSRRVCDIKQSKHRCVCWNVGRSICLLPGRSSCTRKCLLDHVRGSSYSRRANLIHARFDWSVPCHRHGVFCNTCSSPLGIYVDSHLLQLCHCGGVHAAIREHLSELGSLRDAFALWLMSHVRRTRRWVLSRRGWNHVFILPPNRYLRNQDRLAIP